MTEDESVLTRPAPAPDRLVAYGEQPDQQADVRLGASGDARPLLVIIHGGFWRPQYGRDQAGPMAAALAAAGWTVAAIGYRRVPGAPDASVNDVALAVERLPAMIPHHDGRVVVIGHSAGGHLALLAATRASTPPQGVLALAPAANLQLAHALGLGSGAVFAFLGGEPTRREDLDPQRQPAPTMPTVLLHGDDDAVVPLRVSQAYHAAHPSVALRELQCGHFALIDPLSAAWPDVIEALEQLAVQSRPVRS